MANRPKISASTRMVSECCGTRNGTTAQAIPVSAKWNFQFNQSSFPSRPPGRMTRTTSMRKYISANARSWK
jgi:hypothetical protein